MAKKKVGSTGDSNSGAATRKVVASAKAPAASNGKKPKTLAAAKPSVGEAPVISKEAIGSAAGKVWRVLAEKGEESLAGLKRAVDLPGDVVLAAVGWLAREDKLEFAMKGRTVVVALR